MAFGLLGFAVVVLFVFGAGVTFLFIIGPLITLKDDSGFFIILTSGSKSNFGIIR